jgi:hypothetical protein
VWPGEGVRLGERMEALAQHAQVRAIIIAPLYIDNMCWSCCSSSSP